MADISFYKYLEAAFRYRLFNPAGQRASLQTKFNALGYNLPYERIFYYARRLLPKFYTNEFPDTEEGNLQMAKKVLEKLDKHQDIELENQFKAATVSEENAQIITDAQAESQQAEAQQAPPVEAGGPSSGIPGLPSAPSISSAPRAPRIVISHTPDQPFQGPGQGTAATNKIRGIQEKAEIERVGAATAKANRLTAQTTTLRTETQLASPTPPRFNWRGLKMPASFTNVAKNFGSAAQRFIGTNLGIIGRGLGEIAKGIGRGIAGPALTGTYNLLGKAANGGLNAFERLSSPSLRGASRSFMSSGSKKMAWGLVGALVLFVIGAGLLGGLTSTTPTGEASPIGSGCPDTSTNRNDASCHYLNPSIDIFNTTIPQSVINSYIVKNSPIFINAGKGDLTEFTKRTNYIVTNSQQAGLNPAIFLGYWKSESNFSTVGSRDLGCAGDNFYEQVDCALGINTFSDLVKNPIASCVRSRDANSSACISLKSVRQAFDKTHPIKYPVATFDDFAEAYGPYDDLSNGLHTNCTHTYNDLVDAAKELNSCIASSPIVPPPPADGNYKKWLQEYGVALDGGFVPDVYRWTYQVLAPTPTIAPRFKTLLGTSPILVKPSCAISNTQGRVIYLRNRKEFCPGSSKDGPTADENLFKQVFAHELGHIINGSYRPGKYGDQIKSVIATEGYLTAYSKNAATADDEICGAADLNTRADEDFAESISYFVNQGIKEQDYGCGTSLNQNPIYAQDNNHPLYLKHIQLMIDLLR